MFNMNKQLFGGKTPLFGGNSVYAGYRPYVVDVADDGLSAEVNLYGEVVESHPVDFWTGEKVSGLFIALDEFVETLDTLKYMASVRFNINSPGGSVDAGVAIYNKIRELAAGGVDVTTRVEGAADSAASIILQAGTRREVALGSEVMIHGASTLLVGFYNSIDLGEAKQMIDSTDARLAEVYANHTGKTIQEIKRMMKNTTWMTAAEAVENGFADSVVDYDLTVEAIKGVKNGYRINGIPHVLRNGIPAGWGAPEQGMAARDAKTVTDGIKPYDINKSKEEKPMTVEELTRQYPEIVDEIRNTAAAEAKAAVDNAVASAVEAERQRIKDIEGIQNSIADMDMVNEAKYTKPIDAKELAFMAMQKQAKAGDGYLEARDKELADTAITPEPNGGYETEADRKAKDINEGAALISKF